MEENLKAANKKREYKRVTDEERANLIHMVEFLDYSISKASSMLDINYTNAMSIMRIFRRENRTQSIRPVNGQSITYNSPEKNGGHCPTCHKEDKVNLKSKSDGIS